MEYMVCNSVSGYLMNYRMNNRPGNYRVKKTVIFLKMCESLLDVAMTLSLKCTSLQCH